MNLRARPGPVVVTTVGVALLVPYFLLGGRVGDIYWNVVVASMLAVGTLVVWRLRSGRAAWLWILAGQGLFLLGDITWTLAETIGSDGGSTVGDVWYLAGYAAIAAGLVLLVRAHGGRSDAGNLVDAATVSIAAAVLLWVLLIAPAAAGEADSLITKVIDIAYPAADLLLIVVAARLATLVRSSRPAWLLFGSLTATLAGDVWFVHAAIQGSYSVGDPIDGLWWLGYVLVLAAVLDPRLDDVSAPKDEAPPELTAGRIAALAAVAVSAPALIVARAIGGLSLELPVLLGGTMVLFGLVVARLAIVARELEQQRRRLEHQATHDSLTSLGSRVLFADRVRAALNGRQPSRLAVLCLDLDDFKTVNDGLGHAAGDELLREVGRRLIDTAPCPDDVARLGGDEFAVLVQHSSVDEVLELADRLLVAVGRHLELDDGSIVHTEVSIGIAFADPSATVESLLRDADIAMYAAKGRGKGRWEIFRPGMHQHVVERLELRRDLELALDRGEFVVRYQPIVEVASGRRRGYEAMVCWNHPIRGLLHSAAFMPLAEETGLVAPLGRWVLAEACRAVESLRADDGAEPFVSVNLSAAQLRISDIVDDVVDALIPAGLTADRLVVELSETAVVEELDLTADDLVELRELGVKVAIDDFGAGYTSLRQLRTLPVDLVKIDPGLFGPTPSDPMYASVVAMAVSLGLTTIGHGIERSEQVGQLTAAGCHLAQGDWFGVPLAIDEIRRHDVAEGSDRREPTSLACRDQLNV